MPILTASLDDIVFEGRNQAYGAYQLRRDYGNNLASAGSITLGICGLLFAAWVVWPAAAPKVEVKNPVLVQPMDVVIKPTTVIEKPKPAVQGTAAPRAAVAPPAPAIATRVAPDELVPPPPHEQPVETVTTDGAAGNATPGPANALATGATTMSNPGGNADTTEPAAPAVSEVFTYVEKMPEFAGGQAALLRYLREHLRYPSQALREQVEGRVFMSFVVRADGTIAEATVLKGLGAGLDEEALRVVRQMPAWTPGYQAKHAVAVRFTLPIVFKMQ